VTAAPWAPQEGAPEEAVTELGTAFAPAKIVLAALELGVFSALRDGPATAAGLADRLGLHPRGAADFLAALAALGLLHRDGDAYRNTEVSGRRLVRGPGYAGGFLEGANAVLYPAWGGLAEALRTGRPQADGDLDGMLRDPGRQAGYLAMMDGLSAPVLPAVAAAVDWAGRADVTDVGGARGALAAMLLGAHPHLRGTVFDRPQNAGPCARLAAERGVADRLRFRGGDFFADPLPAADVVVIGHVLADFSLAQRRELVRAAYRAVRPGGALVVYDPMPDPDRPHLPSLVASLHMLVMTPAGSGYPPADCRGWLEEAGFGAVEVRPAAGGNTVVVGHRPG